MSRHFLIDGYNVLHKMPELVPQAGKSLADSRDGLVRFILDRRPHGSLRNVITVVFDGSEDVCSWPVLGEVKILFSKGETADDLIKRLIGEAPNPREVILVSDDRDLQYYAKAYAVSVWSVAQFVAQGFKETPAALKLRARGGSEKKLDGKVISEVFKDRVNRELEQAWLGKRDKR